MANPIRAWIVDRTYSPAYTFGDFNRLFQDDIVLSFQSDRITSIDGYDSRTLKIAGLIDGIDNQTLEPLLEKRWQEKLINHRGKYSLSESEWNSLKEVIISRNTDLSRVIDQLEAAQRKPSTIMSTQAITYDIMWSLTDMFRPGNWRQIHQSLRDARELAVRSDRTDLEVFFHSLEESGQYEKVDRVTDPDYALAGTLLDKSVNKRKSGKKPPRTEDSVIFGDSAELPSFSHDKQYYADMGEDEEWNRHCVRMVDGGRELFIFLAHRKGRGKKGSTVSDALGADLIYASRVNKSFVLVQYKLLKKESGGSKKQRVREKLELHGKDNNQLDTLLSVCDKTQTCLHIAERNSPCVYAPSGSIRLATCPVFYKLVGDEHKIVPNKNFIDGAYVQACFIKSRMQEYKSQTLYYPEEIGRVLRYSEFTGLVGNAYIGSRADVFEAILDQLDDVLTSGIVAIAFESAQPSQKANQDRLF
ncbi:MAG TPA: hypothetical protein PLQ56_23305 [Aggregatilineales bacterium]|nr:hypothetical protein [Anaerolineae bacterium]HUN09552.1 hypothetical protein [Aggregatilineales bacterium]